MNALEYQKAAMRTEVTPDFISPTWAFSQLPQGFISRIQFARLMHGLIGLSTETGELEQHFDEVLREKMGFSIVNLIEEVGDLNWYLALSFDALGVRMSDWDPEQLTEDEIFCAPVYVDKTKPLFVGLLYLESLLGHQRKISQHIGQAWDLVKKCLVYGKTPSVSAIWAELLAIQHESTLLIMTQGKTINEVWDRNIAKLLKRYPDKFTPEKALNRDLAAERAALEGK